MQNYLKGWAFMTGKRLEKTKQIIPQYLDDELPPSYPQHSEQTFLSCSILICASSYRSLPYEKVIRDELY